MQLSDLNKEVRRFLLNFWSAAEIESRLGDPEYFFDQVVTPHLNYLRRQGQDQPRIRLQRGPDGTPRVLLLP